MKREHKCHQGVRYVGLHHKEWGWHGFPHQFHHHHHQRWRSLLQWEKRELVVKGGGEESLVVSGGGMGQAKGGE